MSTITSTKLDGRKILQELEGLLIRHRAGLLSHRALKEELAILVAIQKAHETINIEDRISSIEDAVYGGRNGYRR